jgi:hypothetical protein
MKTVMAGKSPWIDHYRVLVYFKDSETKTKPNTLHALGHTTIYHRLSALLLSQWLSVGQRE